MKVFVSSTCYDLREVRNQIQRFLSSTLGYTPVLSDYNDVFFDPELHTHSSCVEAVADCDMMILIIGDRFGGKAVSDAYEHLNRDEIQKELNEDFNDSYEQELFSITQLEVLKAIEIGIPVWTFIDRYVYNDHLTYEKNKSKDFNVTYPNIEKQETAIYIFEFINLLRKRRIGNSIFTFEHEQDIEEALKKQFAGLLEKGLKKKS